MILLCTRRALWLGAAVSLFVLTGYWQAVLAADALLVLIVWVDARLAPSPVPDNRPPPPAPRSPAWWWQLGLLTLGAFVGLLMMIGALGWALPALVVVPAALAVAVILARWAGAVGSSRVDLQACKLEYSIVSPK